MNDETSTGNLVPQNGPIGDVRKYNRGEWAEAAARCYFVINGGFNGTLGGELIKFEGMKDGHVWRIPMTVDPSLYSIEQPRAQEFLDKGIRLIMHTKGRSFSNPPLMELYHCLGLTETKSPSNRKPDIRFKSGSEESTYFAENTASGKASFLNASPATRITLEVTNGDGSQLTGARKKHVIEKYGELALIDGHRKVKARVQAMLRDGLKFTFNGFRDGTFEKNMSRIGGPQLAAVCMCYLGTPKCCVMKKVLEVYKQKTSKEEFEEVSEALLETIRQSIFERGPAHTIKDKDDLCSGEGMIFLKIKKETWSFKLVRAPNARWWKKQIAECAEFDTPDAGKHQYGFVYEDSYRRGRMCFDYAIGIRGSFKKLVKEGK